MTSPRGARAAAGDDVTAVHADGATAAGNGSAAPAAREHGAAEQGARSGQAHATDTRTRDGAEPDTTEGAPPSQPDRPSDEPGREARQSGGYQPGPLWARWLPPVAALLIALFRITGPSFWRDEAATIAAVKRPLGDLIKMLGNVDAVHGAYYLMMWPIEHVLGPGELVLRLPSAIAVAIGAAFVAA
ncbi:MAG TPA: hypothetical protein VF506_09595, partial [Streptosporangiaceae bacterium]